MPYLWPLECSWLDTKPWAPRWLPWVLSWGSLKGRCSMHYSFGLFLGCCCFKSLLVTIMLWQNLFLSDMGEIGNCSKGISHYRIETERWININSGNCEPPLSLVWEGSCKVPWLMAGEGGTLPKSTASLESMGTHRLERWAERGQEKGSGSPRCRARGLWILYL